VRGIIRRLTSIGRGCSCEKLALILAVGLVLGTFPIFGFPTLLCAVAALALRVDPVALQLVNQLSSPLQLALLVPLARVGWRLPVAPGAPELWRWSAIALQAVTGWFEVCVPLGLVLYVALLCVFRRNRRRLCNS
jgi:Uncharacterized protein conserved in bacteria (DUF2062)